MRSLQMKANKFQLTLIALGTLAVTLSGCVAAHQKKALHKRVHAEFDCPKAKQDVQTVSKDAMRSSYRATYKVEGCGHEGIYISVDSTCHLDSVKKDGEPTN
jgi:hypothetical protein